MDVFVEQPLALPGSANKPAETNKVELIQNTNTCYAKNSTYKTWPDTKMVWKKKFCNFSKKDTKLQVLLNLLTQKLYSFCYFDNGKYSSTSLICVRAFFVSV